MTIAVTMTRRTLALFLFSGIAALTVAFQPQVHGSRSRYPQSISPSPAITHQVRAGERISTSALHVMSIREPDLYEMMMGGERYEMVPLPDRMCDTTIFVGNLCEFVHDDDLSQLFQTVSTLQSVPACVVRKANMQSLRYGFVSFLSVEEKEVSGN